MTSPVDDPSKSSMASVGLASSRFTVACSLLFLVGVWLLARPYGGIRHDGILYVGQALLHLYPDIYSQDVFFAHGSQDRFSIFSPIYAWLIDHIGLPGAAFSLMLLGQTAFVLSLFLLARQFLAGRDLWLGLVFVAIIPGFYGGLGIFSYAETFVTARTFAEPLCLLGLWLLWNKRWFPAGVCLALAAAIHPLIALPALALAWVQISRKEPRAWWLALALPVAAALALLQVPPFQLFTESFDPDWLATVEKNSEHLFLRNWKLEDWTVLCYDLGMLLIVRQHAPPTLKSIAEDLLAVGIAAILLSGLFADLWDNVLVTGLQLWRGQWLLHLAAVLLTPWFYRRISRAELRPNAVVVIALLYLGLVGSRYPGGAMALALAGLLIWLGRQIRLSAWVRWLVLSGVLIAIGSVTFKDLKAISYIEGQADSLADIARLTVQGLARPACLTLIAFIFYRAVRSTWRSAGALVAAVTLAAALYSYDQRSVWASFVENGLSYRHPFEGRLSPHSQVYWQGETYGLLGTWLLLKHPSYLTGAQGAGVIFDRETARQFRERDDAFAPLIFQESICVIMNSLNDQHCAVDVEALREVCAQSDAPDYLIIESRIPDLLEDTWTFEAEGRKGNTFYLYRCDRIRSTAQR